MINYNGITYLEGDLILSIQNSIFQSQYGFVEEIGVHRSTPLFLESHYLKIMAKMRVLRMPISMKYTPLFFEDLITSFLSEQKAPVQEGSIKVFIFEDISESKEFNYLLSYQEFTPNSISSYTLDLYNDFYLMRGKHQFVTMQYDRMDRLAKQYAEENGVSGCIFLNNIKELADSNLGNLFFIEANKISTPSLDTGCRDTVIRNKMIEWIKQKEVYTIEEVENSPFTLQKYDAVFTLSVQGIKPISGYRKKSYNISLCNPFIEMFQKGISES